MLNIVIKRRRWLLIAGVAIAVGCALFTWLSRVPAAPTDPPDVQLGGETPLEHSPWPFPGSPYQNDQARRVDPAESPGRNQPQQSEQDRSFGEVEAALRVTVVDDKGSPVNGLVVQATLQSIVRDGHGRLQSLQHQQATSGGGIAEFRGTRNWKISLTVVDDQWYAAPLLAVLGTSTSETIRLEPAGDVSLRAMYDDGLPVVGVASLSRPTPQRPGGPEVFKTATDFHAVFALGNEGQAIVRRVPRSTPLRCTVFAKRSGYDKVNVEFSPSQLASGAELQVIVEKSSRNGAIKLLISSGDVGQGSRLDLEREDWGSETRDLPISSTGFEWGGLRAGSRYRLTLIGPQSWRSNWIEIRAGEVTLVEAHLQPAGSITAKVIDESGMPIQGATLRLASASYNTYATGAPPDTATSDYEGVVVLDGLPPGTATFEAEAQGREIKRATVLVASSNTSDAGTLTLTRATGAVRVHLIGAKTGKDYRVGVLQPRGAFVYPKIPVDRDIVLIELLPLRRYRVGVTLGEFGKVVVSDEFELTADGPMQDVSVDVSGLD